MFKYTYGLLIVFLLSFALYPMKELDEKTKDIIEETLGFWFKFTESIDTVKPFPDILAQAYFTFKKNEKYREFTAQELLENKKQYPLLVKYYQKQEDILQGLRNDPSISPFGGINYAMTLKEMKQEIKKRFDSMKKQGLIISGDEFAKIKTSYYTAHKHTDLTRIWGAEYLRNKINGIEYLKGKYDVPDYIIVADDVDSIKVILWAGDRFPVVGFLENGTIYFKNIMGKPVGCDPIVKKDIGKTTDVCYTDLCLEDQVNETNTRQNDNVIKVDKDKSYIIDTERTSFCIKLSDEIKDALHYGYKKFEYFNGIKIVYNDHREGVSPKSLKNNKQSIIYEFKLDAPQLESDDFINKLGTALHSIV